MTSVLERSTLMKTLAYVGGSWIGADSAATFPVYDPATGERVADVPRMGAAETRRAIEAANAALPGWRATTAKKRAQILRRWYELMLEHIDELAHIMTLEQGKPLAEARGEVQMGAAYVEWNAEEGKRIYGDTIPTLGNDRRMITVKQPIGVCVGITPWNFPHAMVTRKASPALAAGCTFVLKPAEQTPLSALAVAALAEEAGIPPGVFNIVTGDADDAAVIGEEMTSNPIVRKLGFTGSTAVGKLLMEQCARTVKKVSLELGGNAPFIVFDDADLDAAVSGAMGAKFRNAGQVCVSPNRLYVQAGVHDAFVEKLTARVRKLRAGNGFEEGITLGPLIGGARLLEGRRARRGRVQTRCDRRSRRQAARTGPHLLRADDPHQRHDRDAAEPRRDVRARRGDRVVRHRSRRHRDGQRHAVRTRVVLLQPRHRPRLARRRSARNRDGRHQHAAHRQRVDSVRRHQRVGYRSRRFEVRDRRVGRDQVPVLRRAR
jgi:acyl-CoA reductase-like NAD-dependent aldehyde dehydrogenase